MLFTSQDASSATRIITADLSDQLLGHSSLSPIAKTREVERVAFSRSREVDINWGKVISDERDSEATPYLTGEAGYGIEYMRYELERLWGFPEGVAADFDVAWINKAFLITIDPPAMWFSVPNSKRSYVVVVDPNIDPETGYEVPNYPPAFSTLTEYNEMWRHVVRIYSDEGVKTDMSVVDLAPSIIYRQYRELKALQRLGDSLAANADKIAAQEFGQFLSVADIDEITRGYLRMRGVKSDIDLKLERLRDRAKDLGYVLALEQTSVKLPDGTVDKLEAGQLYQPYLTQVSWSTTQSRQYLVRSRSLFFSTSWIFRVPYYVQHVQQVTRYRKVIPDFDPWVEKEQELTGQGFTVFRFERVGDIYKATQGEIIEDVVERCEVDIEFGKRCAVMIPVYEQSLTTGVVLARYVVIKRPRRGVQPIHLPRLFVEESLLFTTHFEGVEVGELVETINLAPGENREIVIEKTTSSEQEIRRTATSISDLTENDRVDLSTEMEREATRSQEKSTTTNLSAKASGSYGAFSGGVEGSTSSTQTTRQFARDLQKVANKASRSVTRQTRQEVQTSSSVKTNVSTRESTKITIENINQGRSLNLLFYQLYNIYRLKLRLEQMSFTLLSGREIIAGSGIVVPEAYSLSELGRAIERMKLAGLPIRPNANHFPGSTALESDARDVYQRHVIAQIKETLREYTTDKGSGAIDVDKWEPEETNPTVQQLVDALATALNELVYTGAGIVPPASGEKRSSRLAAAEASNVSGQNQSASNGPNEDQEGGEGQSCVEDDSLGTLIVGSPGLYLDAHVGARPGTEPYAERMRLAELGRQRAETREINARAVYSMAMAKRLSQIDPGNVIKGEAKGLRAVVLSFAKEPLQGDWELWVEGMKVADFSIEDASLEKTLTFNMDMDWLRPDRNEIARIVHVDTEQELAFLI